MKVGGQRRVIIPPELAYGSSTPGSRAFPPNATLVFDITLLSVSLDDVSRELVLRALRRGLCKRCPHCGEGPLFEGWSHHLERCPVCGLVYERNPGDTWAFTVIGDRLPIAAIIVLIYFGFGRSHHLLGIVAILALGVRAGLDRAEPLGRRHRAALPVARVIWPDPDDPVPPRARPPEPRSYYNPGVKQAARSSTAAARRLARRGVRAAGGAGRAR